MRGHPTDETLLRWLETGRPARVGRHLDECEPCLDRLDGLSLLDAPVRESLGAASEPPPDFASRTAGGVQGRLAATEAAASFIDLFTLPWHAVNGVFGSGAQAAGDTAGAAGNQSDEDEDHGDH